MTHEDQQALADINLAIDALTEIGAKFLAQVRQFGEHVQRLKDRVPLEEVTHDPE